MCKNIYTVTVSGEATDREKIVGKLIMNAANLVTGVSNGFINGNASIVFYFRFKSDAKMVLRNVSKALRAKQDADKTIYGGAVATIDKIS